MLTKPIFDAILPAAGGSGLSRRKLVAGMIVTLTAEACSAQEAEGTFNFARSDYVPPAPTPSPAAAPAPAVPAATAPAQPADHTPELLLVGPGKRYPLLADAGERLVQKWQQGLGPAHVIVSPGPPGYYVNDGDTYSRRFETAKRMAWPPYHGLLLAETVIEGEPGKPLPDLVSDGYGDGVLYYQKGLFVVQPGVNATFRRLHMAGWRRQDGYGNYASVRLEPSPDRANQVLFEDCLIEGCDNGIMGGEGLTEAKVRRCHLARNGAGSGRVHNLYIGQLALLLVEDSLSEECNTGHLLKSRARRTIVRRTRLLGGTGTESACLDVPSGGKLEISDVVCEKSRGADAGWVIHYGGENQETAGILFPTDSSILIRGLLMVGPDRLDRHPDWPVEGFHNGSAEGGGASARFVPVDAQGVTAFGLPPDRLGIVGARMLPAAPILNRLSPIRALAG